MRKFVFLFIIAVSIPLHGQTAKKQLTLETIWTSGTFRSHSVDEVQWLPGDSCFSYTEPDPATGTKAVWIYSVARRAPRMLVSSGELEAKFEMIAGGFASYTWSPDGRAILFVTDAPKQRYLSRLTPDGNYFLYDTTAHTLRRLTSDKLPHYYHKFSPDGSKLGYVKSNDIYVIDIATGKESRLTHDGSDTVINGKGDWEYEEELDVNDAWKWSPDGKRIAFWRTDISHVPAYTLTEWDSLHETLIPMHYPKAGDPVGSVKVGVLNASDGKTVWVDPGGVEDQYLPRVQWTREPDVLAIERLNREQNTLDLMFVNPSTGAARTVLTEKSPEWVDLRADLTFLKNNDFIWGSDRDGFTHLYLYAKDGTLKHQITKGRFEVDELRGVDEASGTLFFTSNEPAAGERSIYAIGIDGTGKRRLTPEEGTHDADVSPNGRYMLDTYSTIAQPPKVRLMEGSGTVLSMIEQNPLPVGEYALGTTRFFSFKTTDGAELNASLLLPDDFDSTKHYPVLIYAYGGPGSQLVLNKWGGSNELWHSLMAAKGYLIFKVDNRGTKGRGRDFMKQIYQHMGTYEIGDQIEGAKYCASLPYVDAGRIGIWGWSYGGFTTSMAMLKGADVFKAGAAVAPVTNWRFYDAPYTERYMNTPAHNPAGYNSSTPLTLTDNLRGKFLLVHGTSDDNVHFQNSVNLVKALQKSNKQFATMFYPDKNHSILGAGTRLHLFTLLTDFLLQNL